LKNALGGLRGWLVGWVFGAWDVGLYLQIGWADVLWELERKSLRLVCRKLGSEKEGRR
jgi:hypothetical protein